MTDDIVARLRLYAQKQRETRSSVLGLLLSDSADEIERLQAELVKLTAQRDEARRLYCEEWAFTIELERGEAANPFDLAEEKGWDCFKPFKEPPPNCNCNHLQDLG